MNHQHDRDINIDTGRRAAHSDPSAAGRDPFQLSAFEGAGDLLSAGNRAEQRRGGRSQEAERRGAGEGQQEKPADGGSCEGDEE